MASASATAIRERKKTLQLIDEYIKSEESEKLKSPYGTDETTMPPESTTRRSVETDPFLTSSSGRKPPVGNYASMLHDFSALLYNDRWASQLCSVIAQVTHTLSHSNLIYFPNLCARYGGAAFLIPYFFSYICVGIPLLYAETALGQFSSLPPVEIFRRLSPPMAGIAVAMFSVVIYRSFYFSAIIAQLLYAGVVTLSGFFSGSMPGSNCDDPYYNSHYCHMQRVEIICNASRVDISNYHLCSRFWLALNRTARVWIPPHTDYMIGAIFKPRFKFTDMGWPPTSVMLILLAVWMFCAACALKGVRSVTGTFSGLKCVCVLIVVVNMIISIVSQDKYDRGLTYFLNPDFSYLGNLETWSNAISHVLFSLNLGDGTVHRLASYNNFNENFIFNAIIVCVCDVTMSLMAGVTFFSAVGTISGKRNYTACLAFPASMYPAKLMHRNRYFFRQRISRTLFSGFTLTMSAFPDQLLLTDMPSFWVSIVSSAHYFNLAKSGFSNLVMYIELIVICVMDALSRLIDWENGATYLKRLYVVVVVMVFGFTMSIVYAGPSGIYLTKMVDEFSGVALIIICLAEIIVVVYVYGFRRFLANVETMVIESERRWKFLIGYLTLFYYVITPFFLLFGFILKVRYNHQSIIFDFLFPKTFGIYGWLIVVLCTIMIPATMAYYCCRLPLNFGLMRVYMDPTTLWGPARPADREKNTRNERVVRKM